MWNNDTAQGLGSGQRLVAISAPFHSELSCVPTYTENKLTTRPAIPRPGVWTESTNNIQTEPPPALLQIYDYKLRDCVHKESIPAP